MSLLLNGLAAGVLWLSSQLSLENPNSQALDWAADFQVLRGVTITVDPGHGGQKKYPPWIYTGGTSGVCTGQTESEVNLRVGLALAHELQRYGAQVILTRGQDSRVSDQPTVKKEVGRRVEIAKEYSSSYLISVHHNQGSKHRPYIDYSLVLFQSSNQSSLILAQTITKHLQKNLDIPSVTPMSGNQFILLRSATMPSVIVEGCFLSCPTQDYKLALPSYNELEGKAIARGLLEAHIRIKVDSWIKTTKSFFKLVKVSKIKESTSKKKSSKRRRH